MCRNKFWATATFNVVGFILTLLFLPDPLRISLAETDRRWRYITAGRTYHGEAINPKSLSIFEWAVLRLHKVTLFSSFCQWHGGSTSCLCVNVHIICSIHADMLPNLNGRLCALGLGVLSYSCEAVSLQEGCTFLVFVLLCCPSSQHFQKNHDTSNALTG